MIQNILQSKIATTIISIIVIAISVFFLFVFMKKWKSGKDKKKTKVSTTPASIKPMTQKEIKSSPNILQLYKEKVIQRDKLIQQKKITDANVVNEDYIKITNYILSNFDEYKLDMRTMIQDDDYRVQAAASIFCLRCGIAEKKALKCLRKYAASKKYGVVSQDARKICTMIDKKKLPYYDGFPKDNEEDN